MQSFARLTEPDKLNVQPWDFDPQSVAIINQIQLAEIVSAGRLIKKIR